MYATNTVLKNMTNYVPTNVNSTVSINSDDKKVRYETDCYILPYVFISSHITIHHRYYLPSLCQNKRIWHIDNIKMEKLN